MVVAVFLGLAAALLLNISVARAGSNNGTHNWWWHKACWINSATNLDVTNYDSIGSWRRQRYHVDADKGTTKVTSIVVFIDGRSTYRWNDFYIDKGDWARHRITLYTNLGSCSIYA